MKDFRLVEISIIPLIFSRKRIFDTSRKIVNGQNDNIRVSMLWASNVDPHENFMGLKVFDDNTYLQMWKNWHSNSTSGKKRPDVIVFNSGIHDLADPEFTFEAYANRLPKVLDLMERSADLVIWKTLNPKYHEFNCNVKLIFTLVLVEKGSHG